jgi:hypothetical protein
LLQAVPERHEGGIFTSALLADENMGSLNKHKKNLKRNPLPDSSSITQTVAFS